MLQTALRQAGHGQSGFDGEIHKKPKTSAKDLEELTQQPPTPAEVHQADRAKRREQLQQNLVSAEVEAQRAAQELPAAEQAYAQGLKEDRIEASLLDPEGYTRRLRILKDRASGL